MYITLSVSAFIYLLSIAGSRMARLAYIGGLLVLLAGMIQLSSRSVLIVLFLNINLLFPFFLLRGKQKRLFIAGSLVISVFSMLMLMQSSVLKNRYVTELKNDLTQQSINLNILEPRMQRWECAWELIKAAPLTGYGSGSEIPLLKKMYFDKKYYNSYIHELNAHNQFLSVLLKTGIGGLLVFIAVLFAGFYQAFRHKDFVYASFMISITVVSFSENILDGNKGIFFFAFFYSMFFAGANRKRLFENKVVAIRGT